LATGHGSTGNDMTNSTQVPEMVVARLRSHTRSLFWPSFVLVGIVGAESYLLGTLDEPWMNIALAAAGVFIIAVLWLLPLISWLGRNYTITTRRIILRSGMAVRVRQELLHSRGYDITVRQNALQSMFGSGDVQINTGLEHPVVLKDVPDAALVQAALHDLMEHSVSSVAARRQAEQSTPDETVRWGYR
jgi:uncharacterized membrane protein YdbT with pleckstrin-like domain